MSYNKSTQSQFNSDNQNSATATRRSYLIGLIGAVGAFAGCLGRGESTASDISVQLKTSEQFEKVASASDPELSINESDESDEAVIKYTIDVAQVECVNAEIDVEFRDKNGTILDGFSATDTFETAETYRVDHSSFISTDEVDEVIVTLHHDSLSGRCYL